MNTKTYHVVVERDEDGYWFVDFPDVSGCHTQGRTLRQARARMRDALSLYVADAQNAVLVEDLRLPSETLAKVQQSDHLRDQACQVQQESQRANKDAVRGLLAIGLTLRDAGEVLGLSYQRVHQLAH